MEIKDTHILVKISPEHANLEGTEIRPGEFLTTKISGHVGRALTVENILGAAPQGVAEKIGKGAWERNAQASGLNTAWVFGSKKLQEKFYKDAEAAKRRQHLNRRGPGRGGRR